MLARLLMLMLASMLPKAIVCHSQVPGIFSSQCQNATRVFLLIEGEDYTINFAAAPAACQSYHATVATTANVEEALQHGLETCKYGWVAEQVAVIPRLTAHSKCGSNKTGLVKWYARADQVFGVFCYSATALPQLSSWPTTSSSASSTTTPDPPPLPSSTPAPTSAFTKTTKAPPTWTPTPAAITTSSPPLPHRVSSSTGDPLPSRAVTSSPAPAASSSSSSPSSSSTSASGSASTQQTPRPTDASMQVWRALITLKLGVGFVIATAAGVLCTYYKLKKGPFSSWAKHVDDVEVEMCKPTYSRTDLHHPLGDDDWDLEAQEEDARDRKYSSEIFLRVNPHLRSSNKMS